MDVAEHDPGTELAPLTTHEAGTVPARRAAAVRKAA